MMTLSTAVMARLFAEFDGAGYLFASVPRAMPELAERLAQRELPGWKEFKLVKGRLRFAVRHEAIDAIKRLPSVEDMLMEPDGLRELVSRLAVSGLRMRPLERDEFEGLQLVIGHGAWCRGIPVRGEWR